eukprot:PhM_4_TR17310/c0_g1_i1/m.2028/K06671/STAG1_2, SCC3, IRR1; cohesin complex subunit SA-1/2
MPPKRSTAKPAPKPKPKAKGKKSRADADAGDIDLDTTSASSGKLLFSMLNSDASILSTADVLLRQYGENPNAALASLLNLISNACGCAVDLEEWQIAEDKVQQNLEEMFSRIPTDAEMYTLANKDTKLKKFRQNFAPFWRALIERSSATCLFEILEQLSTWLTAMSGSKARSFRHTATVAIYSIISALSALSDSMHESLSTAAASPPSQRGNKRSKSAANTELQGRLDEIQATSRALFKSTFVERYRDVSLEIRVLSLKWFRDTLNEFPRIFLSSTEYVKPIAHSLFDKRPEVRLAALEILCDAYSSHSECWDSIGPFTDRFKGTFLRLTRDPDSNCAEAALTLITLIRQLDAKHNRSGADATYATADLEYALEQLFDERVGVRRTTGNLFMQTIMQSTKSLPPETRSKKRSEMLVRYVTAQRQDHGKVLAARYIVDAIWSEDKIQPMLTSDIGNMLGLITSSSASSAARSVLEIVTATMQMLAHNLILGPHVKDDTKRPIKVIKKAYQEDCKKAAAALSEALPKTLLAMVDQFKGDSEVLECVVNAMTTMNFNAWGNQRMAKRFVEIVRQIGAAFRETTSVSLQAAVARFFARAITTDYAMKTDVEKEYSTIVSDVNSAVDALNSKTNRAVTTAAWNRVCALYTVLDLGETWQTVKKWIANALKKRRENRIDVDDVMEVSLVHTLCRCAYAAAMWSLTMMDSDSALTDAMSSEIQSSVEHLVQVAVAFKDDSVPAVVELVANVLCFIGDLALLPAVRLTPEQGSDITTAYTQVMATLIELHSKAASDVAEKLKTSGAEDDGEEDMAALMSSEATQWESAMFRSTQAVTRLCQFSLLSTQDAASIVQLWTRVNSRAVAEIIKEHFKTARDMHFAQTKQPHDFEYIIITQALGIALDLGESESAIVAFQQICSKISQVHFMPTTDKFYAAVPRIVLLGAKHVSENPSADGLLLLGLAAFASRLRVADATKVFNTIGDFNFDDVPAAYRSAFLAALRKAANLAGGDEAAVVPKRAGRRSGSSALLGDESELFFDAMAEPSSGVKRAKKTPKSKKSATHVSEDGWRSRDAGAAASGKRGRSTGMDEDDSAFVDTVAKPSQRSQRQHTPTSGAPPPEFALDDDDEEAFVESQLWDN